MFGVGEIANAVKGVIDKFVPDAKDRLEAENMVFKQLHEINLAQIGVNKEEAKNASIFVAGWRPFTGWVCASTFAYAVIGHDLLNWAITFAGMFSTVTPPILPVPDTTLTFELLMALLGFGGLRSWEKKQGIARTTI